jgi:hypothetical protein
MKVADMNYFEIKKEIKAIFADHFEKADQESLEELENMTLPKGFRQLYQDINPTEELKIGKFVFLPLHRLIDLNIWDAPSNKLYELGFAVVGLTDDNQYYCLNTQEKNSAGKYDVLLLDPSKKFSDNNRKQCRTAMKFLGNSLESLLTKELTFCKKKFARK